jgi:hypothetical protein
VLKKIGAARFCKLDFSSARSLRNAKDCQKLDKLEYMAKGF